MRKIAVFPVVVLTIGAGLAAMAWHVNDRLRTWQVGMFEIHLPSGKSLFLRRQRTGDEPAELYLSSTDDYCAPYRSWHDVPVAHREGEDKVLLYSFIGNTIVVHAPSKPDEPWFAGQEKPEVAYDHVSGESYNTYARGKSELPANWHAASVEFGHNTCSL